MIFPYSPRLADWLEAEAVFIEAKDADGARSYTVGGSSLMLSARKLADEAKGNLQGVERVIWPLYKVEPWSSPALLRKLAAELRGPVSPYPTTQKGTV